MMKTTVTFCVCCDYNQRMLLRYHLSTRRTRFFFFLFKFVTISRQIGFVNLFKFNAIVSKTRLPLQTLLNLPSKYFGLPKHLVKIIAVSERLSCS